MKLFSSLSSFYISRICDIMNHPGSWLSGTFSRSNKRRTSKSETPKSKMAERHFAKFIWPILGNDHHKSRFRNEICCLWDKNHYKWILDNLLKYMTAYIRWKLVQIQTDNQKYVDASRHDVRTETRHITTVKTKCVLLIMDEIKTSFKVHICMV